jgi:hypothetical protein
MQRRKAFIVLGTLTAAALAAALYLTRARARPGVALPAAASAPRATAPASSGATDPLRPGAPVQRDATRAGLAAGWVSARPGFQSSRRAEERGGIEPCSTQPLDDSSFEAWLPLSRGKLTFPKSLASSGASQVDLVIHLHGDEPARRELIESGQSFALLAITLGPSESYAPLLTGSQSYRALIAEVEQTFSKRFGRDVHTRKVALSAWSAGFVGVAAAVSNEAGNAADAVILIDGLHAPRNAGPMFDAQLEPFLKYARLAAAGERFMFISHSSIDPPGFASTTECAHYLIERLGGRPEAVRREDPFGLELVELFSRQDLHVRGYAGNDKADHCAQLALLREVYRHLAQRWGKPQP